MERRKCPAKSLLRLCRALSVLAALALLVLTNQNLLAQSDPLPSWNDGAALDKDKFRPEK